MTNTNSEININQNIYYGNLYGAISSESKFWKDTEDLSQDITNYKITNIKIFFNSGKADIYSDDELDLIEEKEDEEKKSKIIEEKYIVGINMTYKNLYTGETKILERKGTDQISGMKELALKGGEYLKYFNMNFKNDLNRISQINFRTNKNNEITVGIKDGQDKIVEENNKDIIIVGLFGHYLKRISALGCIYADKNFFIKKYLFGFFLLRKLMKDKEFKEKWDKNVNNLDIEFQYLWKTVNLPDAVFSKIVGMCFI